MKFWEAAVQSGVGVRDFWELTPCEVIVCIKAHAQETERVHRIAAWHVAHVINLVAKKPITPAKLLGESSGKSLHGGDISMAAVGSWEFRKWIASPKMRPRRSK